MVIIVFVVFVVFLKHFGKEIIAKELQVDEGHPDVHRLFLAVYKSFMEVRIHVIDWSFCLVSIVKYHRNFNL